jgi:AcrR family transcriptional regulator
MAARTRPASPVVHARRARGGGGRRAAVNGSDHVQLVEIQRGRILAATVDIVCERGAGSVSVADIVERSGVSRRTFYEAFSDRDDCFLAAFEAGLETVREVVLPLYLAEAKWHVRIRAGLVALLCLFDEQPKIARLLVCESLAGGPRMLARREQVLALLTSAVDGGRVQGAGTVDPPALTAEGLVGGVLSVVHTRLGSGHEPLTELTNQLMSMVVLPYLGPGAARRELERPLPAPVHGSRQTGLLSDPFKDAGMRITYRTVRVLSAVAELGEQDVVPSNRLVGERAGISDQGQVSKLLGRLQRIGLIFNSGLGAGLGAPNEWSLTAKGQELTDGIRLRTEGSA